MVTQSQRKIGALSSCVSAKLGSICQQFSNVYHKLGLTHKQMHTETPNTRHPQIACSSAHGKPILEASSAMQHDRIGTNWNKFGKKKQIWKE